MVRVEQGKTFLSDASTQFYHFAEAEEWTRIDRLAEDVASLQARLAYFPQLGRELARDKQLTLRRIGVGRLPYLVWYLWDPRGGGSIEMQRIFHSHQRTPKPRLR